MEPRIFMKYLMKGQFTELRKYLNEQLQTTETNSYDYYKIRLYFIYALLYEEDFLEAKKQLNELSSLQLLTTPKELQLYYYTLLARYYYKIGELQVSKENVNRACHLFKEYLDDLPHPYDTLLHAELSNLRGLIELENGNLAMALDYLMKSYSLRKKIRDKYSLVNSLNNIGIVYLSLGQHENSRMYFDNALKIAHQIDYALGEIMLLNNLGVLYQTVGELDKALQYHELALQRKIEQEHRVDIDLSFYNIARIFEQKGLYTEANDYYLKCLEIQLRSPNPNPIKLVKTYFRLAVLTTKMGEYEKTETYIKNLESYLQNNKVYSIEYRYTLAKAIYYSSLDDISMKITGLELLEKLLSKKMMEKDFTVQAQLYYVETLFELLLLGEFSYLTEDEILDKIEYLLNELNYFYQNQNSYHVLVETLLLQAKFYFIKNNLTRAQFILDQAWISAIEFGFTSLIKKIEEEKEIIKIQEMKPYTEQEKMKESLRERINKSNILAYLEELKRSM